MAEQGTEVLVAQGLETSRQKIEELEEVMVLEGLSMSTMTEMMRCRKCKVRLVAIAKLVTGEEQEPRANSVEQTLLRKLIRDLASTTLELQDHKLVISPFSSTMEPTRTLLVTTVQAFLLLNLNL